MDADPIKSTDKKQTRNRTISSVLQAKKQQCTQQTNLCMPKRRKPTTCISREKQILTRDHGLKARRIHPSQPKRCYHPEARRIHPSQPKICCRPKVPTATEERLTSEGKKDPPAATKERVCRPKARSIHPPQPKRC
jgi:hypothetical protein